MLPTQARSNLRNAIDRQRRADTMEAWAADEAAIARAEADLLALGLDPAAEHEAAAQAVDRMPSEEWF